MKGLASEDVTVGLSALAIAGLYALFTRDIAQSFLADSVGATGLPKAYAAALALLGVVLVLNAWRARHESGETTDGEALPLTRHLRAVGVLLPGAAYLLLIASVGYGVAIFLLILGVALYAGARLEFRLLAVSGVGALALWIIFVVLFSIPLPSGSLWQSWLH